MGKDKSLICNDDSSKKTDPYGELKVFAGSSGQTLGEAICDHLRMELAQLGDARLQRGQRLRPRAGERAAAATSSSCRGPITRSTTTSSSCSSGSTPSSAPAQPRSRRSFPYFSYAKGDKKDEPRVSIRARVCADCIEAAGADRVLTMDLHSPQIQGFFKIPVDHLYAMPVLVDYFRAKEIPDLVVAAPDVGFGKQAYKFGEMMHAPVVFGNKTRRGHDEKAEMLDIVGQVEGKNVLIVDDFTITGGTLIEMAIGCKKRGAKDIYACVSHGVFSRGSAEKIEQSPIKELVLTDTIEYRFEPLPTCCKIVHRAVRRRHHLVPPPREAISSSIHRRESVTPALRLLLRPRLRTA